MEVLILTSDVKCEGILQLIVAIQHHTCVMAIIISRQSDIVQHPQSPAAISGSYLDTFILSQLTVSHLPVHLCGRRHRPYRAGQEGACSFRHKLSGACAIPEKVWLGGFCEVDAVSGGKLVRDHCHAADHSQVCLHHIHNGQHGRGGTI